MLDSKINQIKVSQKTGSEANIGFGRALMPSLEYILSFWTQMNNMFKKGLNRLWIRLTNSLCQHKPSFWS